MEPITALMLSRATEADRRRGLERRRRRMSAAQPAGTDERGRPVWLLRKPLIRFAATRA